MCIRDSGCIPLGQFGRICYHIRNWHRSLSDCCRYACLYHRRLHRGAVAYEMGGRTYPRSLFSRHRSWLFGMAFATVLSAAFLSVAASDIVGGASSGLPPAASVSISQSAESGGPVDYY